MSKQFIGSVGMIRRDGEERDEWLALWHDGRNAYHFPEAHKLEGESFRDSLIREIAWTTGLNPRKDFLTSSVPRLHHEEINGSSENETVIVVEFFLVELFGKTCRSTLLALEDQKKLTWVTSLQVKQGQATDGRSICSQQRELLRKADILVPERGE
ncbi:hypothetical protein [Calycomorphotria hydatis]|uniref:Nudix hydrolase domain-containing protein n=1 Tax=Calycomorphotria hydatis TaxID=2528027 RepID=A0A517T935_9PLAN|nr:hypothetical protein [Calycomorphotria hydatis]QDT64868.1 hypothetical protein V22_21110 [Calycomorphotria hydatis]